MIDPNDYRLAWQAYFGCGVLAIVLWFFLVRQLRFRFLRYWLLLAAAAFLFTPVRHPQAQDMWVPANVSGLLGLMTDSVEVALPMLLTLAAGQVLALILAIAMLFWFKGDKKAAVADATAESASVPATGEQRREPSLGLDD